MTSVAPIANDQDFADGAAAATAMVDAAALDGQFAATKNKVNALIAALALVIRDDDTLVDAVVRLRNLHPEILTAIAARDAWQPKLSVACASTGNLALTGEQTIDGVLTSASRVLVKNQTAPAENGIYVTAAGAWSRATDADVAAELGLASVLVIGGTQNANSAWVQTIEAAAITLGTTSLVWAQYSGVDGTTPVARGGTGQTAIGAWPTVYRRPVRAVATASTNIASPGAAIDGVALSAGDRVLLTAQATGSQNGLWVWNGAAVAMTRPVDFAAASTAQAFQDIVVLVREGTSYASSLWRLSTSAAITIDTTSHAWALAPLWVMATGATTARTLADHAADTMNVRDFGAKADGITNDTAAIQAAHDALPASGGTLSFPAGTYLCDKIAVSKAGVRLVGAGRRASKLKWTGVGSVGTQISEINNGTACVFITASDVEVANLVIEGPSTAAYVARECGIAAIGTSAAARITGLRVVDCEVTKIGAYGIFALFSDRTIIERNRVHDCGYVGIECDSSDDGRVAFNIVKTITPGTSGNMYGISVSHDNALWPGDQTTSPMSKRWDIVANHVEDIAWEGIDSHGTSFVFCAFNTVLNTKNGIGISSGSSGAANYGGTDIQIIHNHVETTGGRANLAHGININGGSTVNAERCVIAYNTVIGKGITSQVGTGAIQAKFAKDVRIHDNVVNAWMGVALLLGTTMDNVSVRGNTFGADADAADTIGYCIYSPATTGDVSVEGNRHEPRGGTAAKYGLRLDGPLGASAVSPVIGWNDFSRAVTGAYYLADPCRPRGPGYGNVIDAPAAATTVDVSGATPGVPITVRFNPTGGNVTVTNLTGAVDGQLVTLTNAHATHSITFDRTAARLAGGASWVGGLYATLELVFNAASGEWWERCRSTTNG